MDSPYRFVAHFIERFGPRKAGTEAETNAQHYLGEQLRTFCDDVAVEPFSAALRAKFSSLRFFTFGFLAALIIPYWSLSIAVLVALVNAVLYLFHFVLFHNVLDGLFSKQLSHNTVGTIEPQLKAENTLIFTGHMDSTPEFIWWYWLKNWGARAMIMAGLAWLSLPIYLLIAWLLKWSVFGSVGWWIYVALAPLSLVFFFIHGNRVVDGAQDNLSGIAIAYEVVRQLASRKLQHTRIRFVSFGAEECGLKGSAAYAVRYREQLIKENAQVINLDGVLDIDNMFVLEAERLPMQIHDKKLVAALLNAFERNGLPKKPGTIPIGGTDATSFTARGIAATSIVGLPMGSLHPTYHTRLDVLECLNPNTLDRITDVLVDFACTLDKRP
ncbi:MAG: M20/M25/M40 family metallo-hydrolase [Flavobacteriales bacterium]|nr:M20/M25/M40 family metallo-hydrolase [Flavobacteriales bacterium]MBK6944280.1 M20/M25/M40 family metallo-hydrolase [Flavobacteriales bacterium]MBK7240481.1 M20/M25/M40 family metallo-hydrolase [Flavobacteriales bacterium]MBK7295222.1 M20/M25/M40 family metallo-hydrolase [Flavobacteriales bacterium]MBK9533948.1 M20/M25/M40 family metallo-hydrolase [Flavobacteriales bacterium]